jgi:hypothetical protein
MLASAGAGADIVFTELGGDLLGGRAPDALGVLLPGKPRVMLCVNDAMGAMWGLQMFRLRGATEVAVSCFKQNRASLARRLGIPLVIDAEDPEALVLAVRDIVADTARS